MHCKRIFSVWSCNDILFILFSFLPVIQVRERTLIFLTHIGGILTHSIVGCYILYTCRYKIDPKYYIGVIVLTAVGILFVIMLIAILRNNYFLLLDDDTDIFSFINHSFQQRNHNNQMDSDFYDAFDKIHSVIYEPYLTLKNKTCPIWLVEYQNNEIIKILPGWYHTFHAQCIENWF